MDVNKEKTFYVNDDKTHRIEWGVSTYETKSKCIRNRFDNKHGKFNKTGSSEIHWDDFVMMILESLKRNEFADKEIQSIEEAIQNIKKQH